MHVIVLCRSDENCIAQAQNVTSYSGNDSKMAATTRSDFSASFINRSRCQLWL